MTQIEWVNNEKNPENKREFEFDVEFYDNLTIVVMLLIMPLIVGGYMAYIHIIHNSSLGVAVSEVAILGCLMFMFNMGMIVMFDD
jgi:hypothetical protein